MTEGIHLLIKELHYQQGAPVKKIKWNQLRQIRTCAILQNDAVNIPSFGDVRSVILSQ